VTNRRFPLVAIAGIIVAGIVVYANALTGEFVLDDHHLVEDNVYIKSYSHMTRFFTEDIGAGAASRFRYYRPLQMVTYAIDYSLWKLNPIGYHVSNVLFHIATACCLFWLLALLFHDKVLSLIASVVYVVHPVHTEAVAYISGRADVLAALFMIMALIAYVRHHASGRRSAYCLMLASYVCALLSKESSLVLPFVFVLYHYTFNIKFKRTQFLPVVLVTTLYGLVRLTVLRSMLPAAAHTSTFVERLPGFFVAIASYLRLLLIPHNLHMEYGDILFSMAHPLALVGLLASGGLLFYAFKKRGSDKIVFFSIVWFFITIAAVSNVYPVGAYMAEHWLYIPSIGLFLLLARGLRYALTIGHLRRRVVFAVIALVLIYAALSMSQNRYWRSDVAFSEATLESAPDSVLALNALGISYRREGKTDEAIAAYKKALVVDPHYVESYINLGFLYYKQGAREKAIALYRKAIEKNPGYAEPYNNLGIIYSEIGDHDEAERLYKKAIEVGPTYAKAYNNLALLHHDRGNDADAVAWFQKAIAMNPDYADSYTNLGMLLYNLGKPHQAVILLQQAIEKDPGNAITHDTLAMIYFQQKSYEQAIACYDKAKALGSVNRGLEEALQPYRK
jgi:tetratricopeptide (TPR) repeat protein